MKNDQHKQPPVPARPAAEARPAATAQQKVDRVISSLLDRVHEQRTRTEQAIQDSRLERGKLGFRTTSG